VLRTGGKQLYAAFPLMKATQFPSGHFADSLRQDARYQEQEKLPLGLEAAQSEPDR
jgi:hypothetical protein